MYIKEGASRYQLVPFIFGQDALAASQTDVQLPVVMGEASQAVDGYHMPWTYEVLAVSHKQSAAATTGSMTIGATIDGTEDADTTITVTTAAKGYKRVPRGSCMGAAGTDLGCEITTGGTWDATTADLVVVIWAMVKIEGI